MVRYACGRITYQFRSSLDARDLPNDGFFVFGFRNPGTSIVVDRREDVEHGKDPCNGETQHPDR